MKSKKWIYQDNDNFAIRAIDIKKAYGKNTVLNGINFEVKKGERVAILGRNGSGKSTLVSLISQQKSFPSGKIIYGYANNKLKALELLGVQFQNLSYPEGFYVKDIIKLFQSAVPLGIRLTQKELADLIELFGIDNYLKQRIDKLSGGQQQRVNIILSLIKRPKLLILDEISSGLDVKSATDIKNYIKKYLDLDKEVSLIIVSHNIEEVKELTQISYVLKDGMIFESFPSTDLTKEKFMEIVSVDIDGFKKELFEAKREQIIFKAQKNYFKMKKEFKVELAKKEAILDKTSIGREIKFLQDYLDLENLDEMRTKFNHDISLKLESKKDNFEKYLLTRKHNFKMDPMHNKLKNEQEKLIELNSNKFIKKMNSKLLEKNKQDKKKYYDNLNSEENELKRLNSHDNLRVFADMIVKYDEEINETKKLWKENYFFDKNNLQAEISERISLSSAGIPVNRLKFIKIIDELNWIIENDEKQIEKLKHDIVALKNQVTIDLKIIAQKRKLAKQEIIDFHQKDLNNFAYILKNEQKETRAKINYFERIINNQEQNLISYEEGERAFFVNQDVQNKIDVENIIKKRVMRASIALNNLENNFSKIHNDYNETKRRNIASLKNELEIEVPKKIDLLTKVEKEEELQALEKKQSKDKSYEDSWTNKIYDFFDMRKRQFPIKPVLPGNDLEIRHLTKKYKKIVAVNDFSLKIKRGQRVAITGSNGSGKSTLVLMIAQIIKANNGEIAYGFGNTRRSVINNVGVQFQHSSFPQEMSVYDVVIFFARANRFSLTRNEIVKALDIFKLAHLKKTKAHLLSGGEKQRLNVLIALIKKPQLVILDEISTGLDIDSIHKINAYVSNYLKESGATLIIISHSYEEIHRLADRLIVMGHGKGIDDIDITSWSEQDVKTKMLEIFRGEN